MLERYKKHICKLAAKYVIFCLMVGNPKTSSVQLILFLTVFLKDQLKVYILIVCRLIHTVLIALSTSPGKRLVGRICFLQKSA